ncbi:MAG TPA: heavy metal translocating P-type ATPase [Xanthomonadales bacterium]|nr:heavy metal translocating P-type ATPase [Xanthomonadales bacterium]
MANTGVGAGAFASCFHCGEPCPPGPPILVERDGEPQPVCCHGCQAVSELIFSSGLDRYYQFRTSEGRKINDDLEMVAGIWSACDDRQELWGEEHTDGKRDLLLQTEGVECSACAWLIRSRIEPQTGVDRVQVDVGTGYTRIVWDPAQTKLSTLALELAKIGYRPHLPVAESEQRARLKERRIGMLRVGVAGLGMMQVMMYAVGLYAGETFGITDGARRFLEWTSLLVTIPVVLFSARPFFTSAISSLNVRRLNMDVPVALAIAVAFVASCFNFLRGAGDVYFDSVVMFVFFLSSARYIQLVQRHRNLEGGAALARLIPEWARRLQGSEIETVLAADLSVGDLVRVRAGETFPADGSIENGTTEVDEALLTGESAPRVRGPGEDVVGGSVNILSPVEMRVRAVGRDSTVSALGRMLLRAGGERNRFVSASERIAGYFVGFVLLIAALTSVAWLYFQPSAALSAALAVLVVSCPCALSLAAPASVSAAGRALLGQGVMMTRGVALEVLARVDVVVFDKTGTLTSGRPRICSVKINPDSPGLDEEALLGIAAALEAHSAHPLAHAFRVKSPLPGVTDVTTVNHGGVSGIINGERWSIGSADFVGLDEKDVANTGIIVWLARQSAKQSGWVAQFEIRDELRTGVRQTIDELHHRGIRTVIASGDREQSVSEVASRLGIEEWHARQKPEMKIERVRKWQRTGSRVLMVGDGVNDAPVLAAADVSMTVSGATDLANSAADFILTTDSLATVNRVMEISGATRRVIRENMTWAIVYNVLALPLAIGGFLQPWMAALGMSLSSLLVVANSARLSRVASKRSETTETVSGTVPA